MPGRGDPPGLFGCRLPADCGLRCAIPRSRTPTCHSGAVPLGGAPYPAAPKNARIGANRCRVNGVHARERDENQGNVNSAFCNVKMTSCQSRPRRAAARFLRSIESVLHASGRFQVQRASRGPRHAGNPARCRPNLARCPSPQRGKNRRSPSRTASPAKITPAGQWCPLVVRVHDADCQTAPGLRCGMLADSANSSVRRRQHGAPVAARAIALARRTQMRR